MKFANIKENSFKIKLFKIIFLISICILINIFSFIWKDIKGPWGQLYIIPIIIASYYWNEKGGIIVALILSITNCILIKNNSLNSIILNISEFSFKFIINLSIAYISGFIFRKNKKYQQLLSESYTKSHFTNLYNTNKLFPELDTLIKKKEKFCLIFFSIINLEEISKYVDFSITDNIIKYFINEIYLLFNNHSLYSINKNEFILIIKENESSDIESLINKFLDNFINSININDYYFKLIIKTGIVYNNSKTQNSIELFNKVRIAADQGKIYESKLYKYDTKFDNERKLYNEISSSLSNAINNNEFSLVYQPIVDIKNNQITSSEILLRWERPNKKEIGPSIFIKVAEEIGLIKSITKWIATNSLKNYQMWKNKNLEIKQSINVSASELLDDSFREWARKLFDDNNICCKSFGIEITERVLSNDNIKLNKVLKELQNRGYLIEIDDFGTGYNSLKTIGEIPFDVIKIDKYFIDKLDKKEIQVILTHIINAVHEIGGTVIAEGVESKKQFQILKNLNCDKIQGFYFSKPLSTDDFYNYCINFDIKNYL